jgi:hypothetical protein
MERKMRNISFSNSISKLIHNIEELELPYASTYKLLKDTKSMKLQEDMIAQRNVQHEKKLFNIFAIESRTIKTEADNSDYESDKTSYELHYWIRIINPRFKCRRYIYPGDYIIDLEFNPFQGWSMTFYQDGYDMYGQHKLGKAEHPHIQRGRGCYGGHKTAIDNSLWSANFYGACKLIRKYIEEYNGRDTYTRGKYFDKKEHELTLDKDRYGYVCNHLSEEQKKEWDSMGSIVFDTHRVKRKWNIIMTGRYSSSTMRTVEDIFNTFKFFNKVGRFENGKEGMPIEQTLALIERFKKANPDNVIKENGGSQFNPVWLQLNTGQAVRDKLIDTMPEYTSIWVDASNTLHKNGSYYLNMKFRFKNSRLESLRKSYYWLNDNIEVVGNSLNVNCPKWFTQNVDIFLIKSNSIHRNYCFDLSEDVKQTLEGNNGLYQEAVTIVNNIKVELEQLKFLISKEKIAYLERERRKILNEINNNTAKPETHQLSLGAL